MKRAPLFVLSVLFCVLVVARTSAADSDPAALETSGSKHFELAEYPAAIADFKEAFRISDRPALLFNIAQAYRLGGDCRQARTFYKTYLRRVPDAPNADAVRVRIDELERCANKPPTVTVPPASPPPPPRTRTWKTTAGIGALAGGAVLSGVGIAFAARGASKASELHDLCAITCEGGAARALDDAGHAANRNALVGVIAGGVLIGAGIALVVLDRPANEGPAVSVSGTSAAATWTWSF